MPREKGPSPGRGPAGRACREGGTARGCGILVSVRAHGAAMRPVSVREKERKKKVRFCWPRLSLGARTPPQFHSWVSANAPPNMATHHHPASLGLPKAVTPILVAPPSVQSGWRIRTSDAGGGAPPPPATVTSRPPRAPAGQVVSDVASPPPRAHAPAAGVVTGGLVKQVSGGKSAHARARVRRVFLGHATGAVTCRRARLRRIGRRPCRLSLTPGPLSLPHPTTTSDPEPHPHPTWSSRSPPPPGPDAPAPSSAWPGPRTPAPPPAAAAPAGARPGRRTRPPGAPTRPPAASWSWRAGPRRAWRSASPSRRGSPAPRRCGWRTRPRRGGPARGKPWARPPGRSAQ